MIIMFLSQLSFWVFRNLNTKYISQNKNVPTLITGMVLKCIFLINTYLGVKALDAKDVGVVAAYLAGGIVGDVVTIKLNKK